MRATLSLLLGLGVALALGACVAGNTPTPAAPVLTPTQPMVTAVPLPLPAGPITLTYWEEDSNEAGMLLDALAAEFMQLNPGIVVVREHYGYDELRNQFRAAAAQGTAPALVRAPGEFAGPFSELGIVLPLNELFSQEYLDGFLAGAREGATAHGKLWGLPDNFGNHLLLLYNKALVNQVPATTEPWIAQLQALADPSAGRYGLAYPVAESYWLIPWLAGFGSWPLDSQGHVLLDSAEMVEALWFVHDLKFLHRVMPEANDYRTAFELFGQGQVAYIIDGAWNLELYQSLGVDLDVALLPRVSKTGLNAMPMATGRYWFIAQGTTGPLLEAAARFVEFMTSAEAQLRWLADLGRLPSHKEVIAGDVVASDPLLAGIVAQLRLARGVPPALEMACAWQGIDAYLPAVMAGQLSPDDAPPQMQAKADGCVEDMGGYWTPTP